MQYKGSNLYVNSQYPIILIKVLKLMYFLLHIALLIPVLQL